MPDAKQAVVVFSGGPDSAAAALWALSQGYATELLTFLFKGNDQYGELKAAMDVAGMLGLKHTLMDFQSPMRAFSDNIHIMMHAGVEVGSIDKSQEHRLPFGAGMVLTTAACYAAYNNKGRIVWGATLDDTYGGRYEYSAEFARALAAQVSHSIGEEFFIDTPLAQLSKHEAVAQTASHEGLLAATWSCKRRVRVQCGTCRPCTARRIAISMARLLDTTVYASNDYVNPLSEEQMRDPRSIDCSTLARIFESERPEV